MSQKSQDGQNAGPAASVAADTGGELGDYLAHYRVDAESIVDPQEMDPLRFASERRRFEALTRMLQIEKGERLLDAGCGSGWLAADTARAGARVSAFDIAWLGVHAARGRYGGDATYSVGDLYHLAYADDSFDIAVLSEVVEHLEDIDGALTEVGRVIRPGGRLLVSVPYRETIVPHLCIHCNQLTPANAHLHRFDEEALHQYLRRAGMQPLRTLCLTNKGLELLRFPLRSQAWPHWTWRLVDRLCNRLTGKAAFMAVLARKNE
jgi:SAM-dependent methyltransferase